MSLAVSIAILASFSIIFAVISMQLKPKMFPPDAFILLLRSIHFFVFLFATTYLFVFQGQQLDSLFIFYCLFLVIHHMVLGDCILNIWERQHYQKDVYNIYLYTFFGECTWNVIIASGIIVLINFIIVVMRQESLPRNLRILFILTSLPLAMFELYRNYNIDYSKIEPVL